MTNEGRRRLSIYLQDHYAGAVAGSSLFHRVAGSHRNPRVKQVVAELAIQVDGDRHDMDAIMASLTVRHSRTKESLAWAAERFARFKPNGAIFRRSPLTDVVELEALSLAVQGKALGLKTLLNLAETEPRLDADQVQLLLDRARAQQDRLEELRLRHVSEVFGS